jgi:hypothetical protein
VIPPSTVTWAAFRFKSVLSFLEHFIGYQADSILLFDGVHC